MEAEACGEAWFSNYCDISCGRCVPEGGLPEEIKVCEDLQPPPDPEWPGATCREWKQQAEACEEAWFYKYCDVTCGRCIPEGGVPVGPQPEDCSGENLPNVSGGEGFATRYWDCCQTHCGLHSGAPKCSQDGVSQTGETHSACEGGGSYACYSEAPHAVSKCLSYGHVAKANADCGSCYRIQFTGQGEQFDLGSELLAGKQMIVKVSNTGSDVKGNQFDLMVPGGGVGKFDACSRQWSTSNLGSQYGGYLAECSPAGVVVPHEEKKACVRKGCMNIPEGDARDGCLWFVDWFEVADNPKFTSERTDCPF